MNKLKGSLMAILFVLACFLFSETTSAQSYIVNPNKTYTYSNMVSDINKLKKVYPDLIQVKTIGKSEYGRDIFAVSIGKGSSTVFINGSHHAREWMTTNVNMNMIDKYAYAYQRNQKIKGYDVRKILTNSKIWFVPMVNPDGVTLQQTGLKHFPKNSHAGLIKMNNGSKSFKRWKANGKGVDLNRQYNAKWAQITGPKSPSYMNYKGKSPHSAKETKAVVSFVSSFSPEIAVSYHSSGEILFWNYQQTGSRYTRDHGYAKALGRMTGYDLVYPKSFGGGGGFSDWFSRVRKKSAFTIEIAPYAGQTHVPLSRFSRVWSENSAVGLYVAQEGGKLYDSRQLAASQALEKKIKAYDATAKKLQPYYDIKVASGLKVDKAFKDLYNKVNSEVNKNQAAINKLPSKYRSRPTAALKPAKTYRDNSLNFMNAVTDGDKLVSANKTLTGYFEQGKLDSTTVSAYNNFNKSITNAEARINKMYGTNVKKYATAKYITPAKVSKENLGLDISRYNLILLMEKQVVAEDYVAVEANLTQYDQQTKNAEKIRAKKNYIKYPATETFLANKITVIKGQLPPKPVEPAVDPQAEIIQ
ncbi:M14 family zinc carboxypeptidase [Bacillus sp. V59.32b]|uniref:M14 family zinc carboxypeptidase n=1 Tax=Bacillus sp. V59.32b TaxID=1758642 RepID=UPI00135835F6|nr:M14 family zinc carboxypeptidase [Bacillus sp. V59.32b]